MAATYPCGHPGSSSFASHWRFFATPTRRYHGRMLIHPASPACANPSTKVFAHTQVRDPRESAAACFWPALGTPSSWPPVNCLWKVTPKIILNSPELNCSVFFSLYCLRMSKKIDHFLRNLVRRVSWFNINLLSFIHRNDAR